MAGSHSGPCPAKAAVIVGGVNCSGCCQGASAGCGELFGDESCGIGSSDIGG